MSKQIRSFNADVTVSHGAVSQADLIAIDDH